VSVEYTDIYKDRTGQSYMATPQEDDATITVKLDRAAFMHSRVFATPWSLFTSVPEKYKYPVTLLAAKEFWYGELSKAVSKHDVKMGATGTNTTANKTASSVFTRIMQMIKMLEEELDAINIDVQGSGDIIVGDLMRRDRNTGRLVPRADDPVANWLTNG
jgi:hypothetical protein